MTGSPTRNNKKAILMMLRPRGVVDDGRHRYTNPNILLRDKPTRRVALKALCAVSTTWQSSLYINKKKKKNYKDLKSI